MSSQEDELKKFAKYLEEHPWEYNIRFKGEAVRPADITRAIQDGAKTKEIITSLLEPLNGEVYQSPLKKQ